MTKERLRQIWLWFFFNPFWMVIALMYWQSSVYMDDAIDEKSYLLRRVEREGQLYEQNDAIYNQAIRNRGSNSNANPRREGKPRGVALTGS